MPQRNLRAATVYAPHRNTWVASPVIPHSCPCYSANNVYYCVQILDHVVQLNSFLDWRISRWFQITEPLWKWSVQTLWFFFAWLWYQPDLSRLPTGHRGSVLFDSAGCFMLSWAWSYTKPRNAHYASECVASETRKASRHRKKALARPNVELTTMRSLQGCNWEVAHTNSSGQ